MADENQQPPPLTKPPPPPSQQNPPPLPNQTPPPVPPPVQDRYQNPKFKTPERWDSLRGGKGAQKSNIEGPISKGLGGFSDYVSDKAKKTFGQGQNKQQQSGPGGLAEKMSGMDAKGDAGSIAKNISDTLVQTAMDMDIIIMLPIAVMFDLFGIVALILSIAGLGIPLQEVVDVLATIILGFWIIARTFLQSITLKAISAIENTVSSVGRQASPSGSQGQASQSAPGGGLAKAGGKVAKKGLKVGVEIAWWLVLSILKLIPILGDLIPSYTILVIRQFNLIKKAQAK